MLRILQGEISQDYPSRRGIITGSLQGGRGPGTEEEGEGGHVTTEAEVGAMWPHLESPLGFPLRLDWQPPHPLGSPSTGLGQAGSGAVTVSPVGYNR